MTAYRTMPIAAILKQVSGSLDVQRYGQIDWWSVLAAKVSHSHFDHLVDTIMAEGFTLPIVMVETGEDWDGEPTYTLGNGHHRLCAAILLGLDEIPVVITDGDYWRFEDSHDGEWNPGDRSFDYWGMLNRPDGYWGDEGNEIHRDQFAGNGDSDSWACQYCGDTECAADCETEEDEICEECGIIMNGWNSHLILCRSRYLILECSATAPYVHYSHYADCPCTHLLDKMHAGALGIHVALGFLPIGAWHPLGVLAEAYEDHARWEIVAAQDAALELWQAAIREMRESVAAYAGIYRLTEVAEAIAAARAAYDVLLNG